MDKKEIYEHLAKIYLDASTKSSKKKRRIKSYVPGFRSILISVSFLIIGIGSGIFLINYGRSKTPDSQVALFLTRESAKINFNFNPAKAENFTLNLNKLNLSKYKSLGFSAKKDRLKEPLALRIEFISRFNEKSEFYIRDIPQKWSEYNISFGLFKKISNWQEMKSLAFCVEEWNTQKKSGVVYLDNIRLLK